MADPRTDLQVVWRPVDKLVPYARNARTHSAEQVAQIAASVREFGWTNPILIDEQGGIIAGHGRVMAARQLNQADVPTITLSGLTETQRRAYVLADNKLALNAGWDMAMLSVELQDLDTGEFDLQLTGFAEDEVESILTWSPDGRKQGLTDPDEVPPVEKTAVSALGDVWIMGKHRIVCGDTSARDAVDVARGMDDIDLIVTSPPYNQKIDGFKPSGMHKEHGWVQKVGKLAYRDNMPEDDYQDSQRAMLALWHDVVRDGGSVFYNHKNRYRDKRVVSPLRWLPDPFSLRQEIVWSRPGSVTQNARMFLPCDERIYWLYKGKDFWFDDTTEIKTWSSIWEIAPRANTEHAVAFPVEIPIRAVIACSRPGELVFDPYTGSGTTMIAAEQLGRRFCGIELNPLYVDVSVRRWQAFTGQQATREADGVRFDDVATD